MAVNYGLAPSEFWEMHPDEFWWWYKAKTPVDPQDEFDEIYEATYGSSSQ